MSENDISTEWLGGEFYFNFFRKRLKQAPIEKIFSRFKGKKNLNILEIGCCEGQSALWFIKNILMGEGSKITCIDPYEYQDWYLNPDNPYRKKTDKTPRELFQKNILEPYKNKVNFIEEASEEALLKLDTDNKFDIIHVDGNHAEKAVFRDGLLSWYFLKRGGVIMFDDYSWEPCSLGIDKFLSLVKDDVNIIHDKWVLALEKK